MGTNVVDGLGKDNPVNTAIEWEETPENGERGGLRVLSALTIKRRIGNRYFPLFDSLIRLIPLIYPVAYPHRKKLEDDQRDNKAAYSRLRSTLI